MEHIMNFEGLSEFTFSAIVSAIAHYYFGEIDGLMQALVSLTICDYITGVIVAGLRRELSSSIGFNGIAKKITIFIVVGLGHVIDRELLGGTALLRDAVLFFYLANEGLSILENAISIGLPVPDVIKDKLLAFHDQSKEQKNEE